MTLPPTEFEHDGQTDPRASAQRFGWAVVAMALLLIPLGLAAYLLIQLPGGVGPGTIFENEEVVLTGSTRGSGTDQHFNYELYSLRTTQTHEFTSELFAKVHHNTVTWVEVEQGSTWHVKQFDAERFLEVSLGKVVLSAGQDPNHVHATGLIAGLDQKSNLFISEPHTGKTLQLELPLLASNRVRFAQWCRDDSPQLIVSEYLARGSGLLTLRWYTWSPDKIELRSEWTSSTWPYITEEELLRVRDNHDLEILRLVDGATVETQPLRDRFKLQPGAPLRLMAVEPPIAVFQLSPMSPKNFVVYDYRQQRILGELDGMRNNAPVIRPRVVMFEGNDTPGSNRKSRKQYSWEGKLLSTIPLDERMDTSRQTADGKRQMVLWHDKSVREIDLATGKTLRTWRSTAWVLPTLLGVIVGFCVWFGCWIRLGRCMGWHPLTDVAVWNGLIAAGILSRVWLGGPAYSAVLMESLALPLSWLQFAAVWLIFGPMRWSLRALAPMLAGTCAVGALLIVFRQQPPVIPLIFVVAVLGMLALVGVLCLPYRWGWRMAEPGWLERPVELRQGTGQLPLRDLFAIVGAVALFLAIARFVPFHGSAKNDISKIITTVIAGLGSATVGVWAALSPRHWTLRMVVFLCAILASACLPGLYDFRFWSWTNWWMFLRFPAATAVFVAGSLLAFRVRGWRWMRTAK